MIAGLPPVARLAVVFAAGSALVTPGAWFLAPLLILLVAAPIRASRRPELRVLWAMAAFAGATAGLAGDHVDRRCDLGARDGAPASVTGRLLAEGIRTLPFEVHHSRRCRVKIRIKGGTVPLGPLVDISGRWSAWSGGFTLEVDAVESVQAPGWDPMGLLLRWRGHLVRRLHVLYPDHGGVVAALTLARKESLDPDVRESFVETGTAHLLAISGFHVGVVAGILMVAFRSMGAGRRPAGALAAGGAWVYVAFIGFPAAACRAALILTAAASTRWRGRPVARFGALGAALLALVVWDPGSLSSPGFQLSFAGAGALVRWGPPVAARLRSLGAGYVPRGLCSAAAAGMAATLGTLPIVAWHFERVSLVGIPATLVASPLVVLALPGALVSLGADLVSPAIGGFLAGGVTVVLVVLTEFIGWLGSHDWASVWVTRGVILALLAGASIGLLVGSGTRIRARVRRSVAVLAALASVVGWPLLQGVERRGTFELLMIDVGQGDAIALRTPGGRWILVDAGPPARSADPGAQGAVRALRRRGVGEIDLLVLTHPDLDHIGGAVAVLRSFQVRRVLDPGLAAGKGAYLEVLEAALDEGSPWLIAEAGQVFDIDGVKLRVLHPDPGPPSREPTQDANDVSVVIHVEYGDFDALLTGDAPTAVERSLAQGMEAGFELLKVAHHGSDTSTDSLLLARVRPEVALVSVGRGNRYGHPSPSVLARLESADIALYRTDRQGTIRVRARQDGRFTVRARGIHGR